MTFTQTDDAILTAMESHGGSFIQALALACRRADPINLVKIKTAFADDFVRYAEVAGMLARRRDAAAG